MLDRSTVRGFKTPETMPLHNTLETLSDPVHDYQSKHHDGGFIAKKEGPKNVRDTLHINKLSRDKVSCTQFCPHGHHSISADLELFQSVLWFHTRLPKMSKLLLCCRLFTPRTGTDLQSVVR